MKFVVNLLSPDLVSPVSALWNRDNKSNLIRRQFFFLLLGFSLFAPVHKSCCSLNSFSRALHQRVLRAWREKLFSEHFRSPAPIFFFLTKNSPVWEGGPTGVVFLRHLLCASSEKQPSAYGACSDHITHRFETKTRGKKNKCMYCMGSIRLRWMGKPQ